MPSFTEFIETPEAYNIDLVTKDHPQFINRFVEYLTVPQDPLLCNERECYLYPSKTADILAQGMSYRLMIQKTTDAKGKAHYPFLADLFRNMQEQPAQPTLLGYCNKILISLVKKTPEIYEFIKDNQQGLIQLIKDDTKLSSLSEFITLFLIESTMELYVFLKSMIIRNVVFRIVEEDECGVVAFRCIKQFYQQVVKAHEEAPEDQKEELVEIRKNFEEENLMTLLLLKIESGQSQRNQHIADFLSLVCGKSEQMSELLVQNISTIFDFLEEYEDSSIFMQTIRPEHISLLRLLVRLIELDKLPEQVADQTIKRLLVYSHVHSKNSMVHNLLYKSITLCGSRGRKELLNRINIVEFMVKNITPDRYAFMSLRSRIFRYWAENDMIDHLEEEEKEVVLQQSQAYQAKVEKSKYYREVSVKSTLKELSATKMPNTLFTAPPINSPEKEEAQDKDKDSSQKTDSPLPQKLEDSPQVDKQ